MRQINISGDISGDISRDFFEWDLIIKPKTASSAIFVFGCANSNMRFLRDFGTSRSLPRHKIRTGEARK